MAQETDVKRRRKGTERKGNERKGRGTEKATYGRPAGTAPQVVPTRPLPASEAAPRCVPGAFGPGARCLPGEDPQGYSLQGYCLQEHCLQEERLRG
jgi:hypothetical protein